MFTVLTTSLEMKQVTIPSTCTKPFILLFYSRDNLESNFRVGDVFIYIVP